MRKEQWADLDICITGGTDALGGGHGPLVVLLHGFGAPGDDLVPLTPYLQTRQDVRFLFPAAPLSLNFGMGDARAWWMLDMERLMRARAQGQWEALSLEIPRGLESARTRLADLLQVATHELAVPQNQLVLGGFSQGSMLALDYALHSDISLAGLILLSSTLIAKNQWLAALPARQGLAVFQSHGQEDDILAHTVAQQLRDHLLAAGLPVQWVDFPGGHEIPFPVLNALGSFLHKVLPPPA
ncbi:MAG: alpha/beta fold hydrolase [Nitrospira sp.]|nr:alpha/beta fold hydrolase [Nitrospira sp.]MCA9474689.1 alpha/beta fold hydrolase [Nitrospira sp.]MCA9481305.1 alpha/beta fold hydrolase [Nitrospira sp.]MCB9710168.1 alpha/beta fold hydrolase [Nitrospiraceae bacterium]HQU28356.1 alpha/beta fold hydrolase [Nitrospirales bacterium]